MENRQIVQHSNGDGEAERLDELLDQLRRAGQHPDRGLLDRLKAFGVAAVPRVIELALDEELHFADSDDPAVWAPLHAISLLGELRAAEAVSPLLALFEWDDDWLPEALETAFGQIGRPAITPLAALLGNRSASSSARTTAVGALREIGKSHPELRRQVVTELVRVLSRQHPMTDDDAEVNGFIVSELMDLRAVDAAPEIERAFESRRVDTFIIDAQDVERSLGITMSPKAKQTQRRGPLGRMIDSWQMLPDRPIMPGVPARKRLKVGRNDPCPCGSGKKYKKCHGR